MFLLQLTSAVTQTFLKEIRRDYYFSHSKEKSEISICPYYQIPFNHQRIKTSHITLIWVFFLSFFFQKSSFSFSETGESIKMEGWEKIEEYKKCTIFFLSLVKINFGLCETTAHTRIRKLILERKLDKWVTREEKPQGTLKREGYKGNYQWASFYTVIWSHRILLGNTTRQFS